jgi:hypothetical protein
MTQRLSGDVEVDQHFAQKHDFDTVYKWSANLPNLARTNKLQRALQNAKRCNESGVRRERMSIPLLKNLHILLVAYPCCFKQLYIHLKQQLHVEISYTP